MRLFSGILLPTAGEAFILGYSIKKEAERIKDRIGYMSQRFALYGDLTVLENIHFYADLYAVPKKEMSLNFLFIMSFLCGLCVLCGE